MDDKLQKLVFGKKSYDNTIDTSFKELANSITKSDVSVKDDFDVNDFWKIYNEVFFDLPSTGDNSHYTIAIRSGDEAGLKLEELIEEIKMLREDNVILKNEIFLLTQNKTFKIEDEDSMINTSLENIKV